VTGFLLGGHGKMMVLEKELLRGRAGNKLIHRRLRKINC
jgi:hypothetical protein